MDEIRLDWQMFNMTATTATVARQAHTAHTQTHTYQKNGNIRAAEIVYAYKGNAPHTFAFTLDPFVCSSIQSIAERTHIFFYLYADFNDYSVTK